MHWPQLMQLETFKPSSKAVPTLDRRPRPMKSIAATPWISSQTRTQLPQRMHLAGSRTMRRAGDVQPMIGSSSPRKRRSPDAQFLGQRLQLAVAVAHAVEAVVRMVGQQQLDDGLARLDRPGRMRLDLHALGHRAGAAGNEAALALDLHDAHAAGAGGGQPFDVAERGNVDPRPPQRRQEHLALLGLDGPVVDFDRNHRSLRARVDRSYSFCVDPALRSGMTSRHTVPQPMHFPRTM